MRIRLTKEAIENLVTNRGGWSRGTLAILGVPWPPVEGWRRRLTGIEIDFEVYNRAAEAAVKTGELFDES